MISLRKAQLPIDGLDLLIQESIAEGHQFLSRLQDEWASGVNRFSATGECLYLAFAEELPIAIGGLTRDPFVDSPTVGRLRRIYVRSAWRRRGIGADLVSALLREAQNHFAQVRLRAANPDAARLYEKFGFERLESPDATHILTLRLS
jgi:GNAT superfamily N-acetyltransferase